MICSMSVICLHDSRDSSTAQSSRAGIKTAFVPAYQCHRQLLLAQLATISSANYGIRVCTCWPQESAAQDVGLARADIGDTRY